MAYETLLTELENRVLTVTLNRPERLNALSPTMLRELLAICDEIDSNDEIRVVIFTGAGRGFCAGADLSGGSDTFDNSQREPAKEHRDGGGLASLEGSPIL